MLDPVASSGRRGETIRLRTDRTSVLSALAADLRPRCADEQDFMHVSIRVECPSGSTSRSASRAMIGCACSSKEMEPPRTNLLPIREAFKPSHGRSNSARLQEIGGLRQSCDTSRVSDHRGFRRPPARVESWTRPAAGGLECRSRPRGGRGRPFCPRARPSIFGPAMLRGSTELQSPGPYRSPRELFLPLPVGSGTRRPPTL